MADFFVGKKGVGIGTTDPRHALDIFDDGKMILEHKDKSEFFVRAGEGQELDSRWVIRAGKPNNRQYSYSLDPFGVGTTKKPTSPTIFIVDGGDLEVTGGSIKTDGSFIASGTTLNVPDEVFTEGYDLKSPEEVAAHIGIEGRLPEVPSESEIHRDGVDLADFQMLLLRKIEELTLYVVSQHRELRDLGARQTALETRVAVLSETAATSG